LTLPRLFFSSLSNRFHFSFADWYGSNVKQNFGALRVLNDDLVKPRSGFGAHPHRNAEIFSYIVSGALSHADSMGNKESLPAGGIQYMSAGTGVVHSEMNDEAEKTCRFLQIWLTPDKTGHQPQYGSFMTTPEMRHNTLLAVLQGTGRVPYWATPRPGEPITLHQDATVIVSQFDPNFSQEISLGRHLQAYIVCIEGTMDIATPSDSTTSNKNSTEVSGTALGMREAAEIVAGKDDDLDLVLTAGKQGAHFMIIEMSSQPGQMHI
jgi:redox-sensitive bicupin YhaK (pirin superfamily)